MNKVLRGGKHHNRKPVAISREYTARGKLDRGGEDQNWNLGGDIKRETERMIWGGMVPVLSSE